MFTYEKKIWLTSWINKKPLKIETFNEKKKNEWNVNSGAQRYYQK